MSDVVRMQYAMMRTLHGLDGGDFLIADSAYPGIREPDYTCHCAEKHKARRITDHCPVMQSLLGPEASAEYFARRQDLRDRREILRLPAGRVPLSIILES